mmetsp:Transcript_10590/g.13746  ORF Transcript_10590/g.13746 Transcript_10590/m.13746 type:complete len:378 (+) Transcript_10590:97-1230(+)|eukprot:CAMPEP_0117763502 /NCGR_PEP_ID=MMETSP0947-20121206/18696_1 /TAXON_ID=44440 /ORGANISM="Chattonella subsalsa, Strain CCMP2191" /LENGTH=377 /DNA_ID=CAMNT_0005585261 /DNA_START=54 /DNA_END=1187 /DNA_ORIENTATION=-
MAKIRVTNVLRLLWTSMLVSCLTAFNYNLHMFSRTGIAHHDIPVLHSSVPLEGSSLFSSSMFHTKLRAHYFGRWQALRSTSSGEAIEATGGNALEQSVEGQEKISYGLHIKLGKKKRILNLIGLMFCFNTMVFCTLYFPFVVILFGICKIFDDKRRRLVDYIVHYWAKTSMLSMFYKPKIVGTENLPPNDDEGVLYLANHTSFLDILTLSGFLPRVFKYVSKAEVLRIPMIGWSMQMAGHIAIRRASRKSQLVTVKNTITALQNGNSVCMFPEGTRTKTGRINNFKKGPFTIAKKAGVRVVPISLCNVTKWFPSFAVMPLGRPTDIVVKIHPPIDSKDLTEKELMARTFDAIEGGLPSFQRRLQPTPSKEQITDDSS